MLSTTSTVKHAGWLSLIKRKPARRKHTKPEDTPQQFGDLGNADYIVAQSKEAMGLTGERDALVIVDRANIIHRLFPAYVPPKLRRLWRA